tara:strand:+ start:233 stop:1798 length:1566 start_codon:yes stop_codon:yes gene_type:complete
VSDIATKFKSHLLKAIFLLALIFQSASLFADKVDYVFETESVSSIGDAADDPAIWFNQANPTKSLIFGTDKRKGIHVYDIYGKELSFSELGATNNIDLRVIDKNVHMVISNRSSSTLGYWIFPESGLFEYFLENPINAFTEDIIHYHLEANMDVYGVCMGFVNGRLSAALTEEEGPTVQMWDLTTKKVIGEIDVISDEENAPKTGNEAEGCVFDDENSRLLISREGSKGYLKAYESDTLQMIEVVDSRDGNIIGDPEGVAIYKTSDVEGYIILSSQGGNEFNLYDRVSLDFISKFKINAVEDTDGLDVTNKAVEGVFPSGFLVVQDGRNLPSNQNFKIVNIEEVLKKKTEDSWLDSLKNFSVKNPLLAPLIIMMLGFLESFVITGFFFPSLFLYLMAVFLYLEGISSLFYITLCGYIGSFSGDQSSYLMGRIYGTRALNWQFIKDRKKQVDKVKSTFDKYEFTAILIGRMTPSLRPFSPFFVGVFRLNYQRFLLFDLIACSVWASGLILLVVLWDYIASLF